MMTHHAGSSRVAWQRLLLDVARSDGLEAQATADGGQKLTKGFVVNLRVWQVRRRHFPFLQRARHLRSFAP